LETDRHDAAAVQEVTGSESQASAHLGSERVAVLLGSSAARNPLRKGTKESYVPGFTPRLGGIPENRTDATSCLSGAASPIHGLRSSEETPMGPSPEGTPRETPRCSRWPSISSVPSSAPTPTPTGTQLQALKEKFPASSYAVSDEPVRILSRHIAFAPSPTHSVHQSEHSVAPYGEIYGLHPMSFEFDAAGNQIPRVHKPIDEKMSPRNYIEGIKGIQVLQHLEPMGPVGAIRYN